MKKAWVLLTFLTIQLPLYTYSQGGVWTWMGGDTTINSLGHFGTKGVSSIYNHPPALYESGEWSDKMGNFWLLGGLNYPGTYYIGNTLWRLNPVTLEWTWMSGDTTTNQHGVYGTIGVPDSNNHPASKGYGMITWVDTSGNLWLYGGFTYGIGYYNSNDMWKYDISSNLWTWLGGSISNVQPTYGILGVPSLTNNPGSRGECAASWTDKDNNLWFFGGETNNDLWKYSIATGEWTWMSGSDTVLDGGDYGIKFISSSSNRPPARSCYSAIVDTNSNLILFGGGVYNFLTTGFNDVWKFDLSTNEWTWIGGNNSANDSTFIINSCVFDSQNSPAARYENRGKVRDSLGRLWSFGGFQHQSWYDTYEDMWVFDPNINMWALAAGPTGINGQPVYGWLGIADSSNHVGCRAGAAVWQNVNDGSIWVYGGNGRRGNGNVYLADLWKFTPDYTCFTIDSLATGLNNDSIEDQFSYNVFPNPTNQIINIQLSLKLPAFVTIELYDVLGNKLQQIVNGNQEQGEHNATIDAHKLSNGVYVLQIRAGEQVVRRTPDSFGAEQKIVVMH